MGSVHYIGSNKKGGSKNVSADTKTISITEKLFEEKNADYYYKKFGKTEQLTKADGTRYTDKRGGQKAFQTDYSDIGKSLNLNQLLKKLNRTVGIIDNGDLSYETLYQEFPATLYNRFKLPVASDKLMRGFGHVFFVRPNCNVLREGKLTSAVKNNATFSHIFNNSPRVLNELVINNGTDHDFALAISNAATNFPLSDEFIEAENYGRTWTGYKIAYGKHNIDSKTAGEITINYRDDRNLHIYKIHKLWVEYISGCYRGEMYPRDDDLIDKILDYASAVYYVLTAEDGETVLFWTKYYGVFPTTIPSDPFTWAEGNVVGNPEFSITYKYSFKEDYNPLAITEFNRNARMENVSTVRYAPVYDPELGHSGDTWVGKPFIEIVKNGSYAEYKLRFIRANDNSSHRISSSNNDDETSKTTYNSASEKKISKKKVTTYPNTYSQYKSKAAELQKLADEHKANAKIYRKKANSSTRTPVEQSRYRAMAEVEERQADTIEKQIKSLLSTKEKKTKSADKDLKLTEKEKQKIEKTGAFASKIVGGLANSSNWKK